MRMPHDAIGSRHYYMEVQPVIMQLPGVVSGYISELVNAREQDFDETNPVPPNQVSPNQLLKLTWIECITLATKLRVRYGRAAQRR